MLDDSILSVPATSYTDKDGKKWLLLIDNFFNSKRWREYCAMVNQWVTEFERTGNPVYPYKLALLLDQVSDTYYKLPLTNHNSVAKGKDGSNLSRAEWENVPPNPVKVSYLGIWNRGNPTFNRGWITLAGEAAWAEPFAKLRMHPAFRYYSQQKYNDPDAVDKKVKTKLLLEIARAYKTITPQLMISNYQDGVFANLMLLGALAGDQMVFDFAAGCQEATLYNGYYNDSLCIQGSFDYMMMLGNFTWYMNNPSGWLLLEPDFLERNPYAKVIQNNYKKLETMRGIGLEWSDKHLPLHTPLNDLKTAKKMSRNPSVNFPGYGVSKIAAGKDNNRMEIGLAYTRTTSHSSNSVLDLGGFYNGIPVMRQGGYGYWWGVTSEAENNRLAELNFPKKLLTVPVNGFQTWTWSMNHSSLNQNTASVNDLGIGEGKLQDTTEMINFKGGEPYGSLPARFQIIEAMAWNDSVARAKLQRAVIAVETNCGGKPYVADIFNITGDNKHTLYLNALGERVAAVLPAVNSEFANLAKANFSTDELQHKYITEVKKHDKTDAVYQVEWFADNEAYRRNGKGEPVSTDVNAKVRWKVTGIPSDNSQLFSAKGIWSARINLQDMPDGTKFPLKVLNFDAARDFIIDSRSGKNLNSTFINFYEGADAKDKVNLIKNVKRLEAPQGAAAVEINLENGDTDTLIYQKTPQTLTLPGGISTDARYALSRSNAQGDVIEQHIVGGTFLKAKDQKLQTFAEVTGVITDLVGDLSGDRTQSAFIIKADKEWDLNTLNGKTIKIAMERVNNSTRSEAINIESIKKIGDLTYRVDLANHAPLAMGWHQVNIFESGNIISTSRPLGTFSSQDWYKGVKAWFPRVNKVYPIAEVVNSINGNFGGTQVAFENKSTLADDGVKLGDWFVICGISVGNKVSITNSAQWSKQEFKPEESSTADDNCWRIDNKNFDIGDINQGLWRATADKLKVEKNADGLSIRGNGVIDTYVTTDVQYPWFCWELKSGSGSFITPNLTAMDSPRMMFSGNAVPGYYALKFKPTGKQTHIRMDFGGANYLFSFMSMNKTPRYLLEAVLKDNNFGINLTLPEAAVKVELSVYQTYPIIQLMWQGQNKAAMMPQNDAKTQWTCTIPNQGFKNQRIANPVKAGQLMFVAKIDVAIQVIGINYQDVELK
jgi:hypothetical protein